MKTINNFKGYEEFLNYIDNSKLSSSKQKSIITIFKKIRVWETATNSNIENWDKDYLTQLCKSGVKLKEDDYLSYKNIIKSRLDRLAGGIVGTSYSGLYNAISAMNYLLINYFKKDIEFSIGEFEIVRKHRVEDLFKRDEIIKICNSLTNPQDKYLIYGLFCGIKGREFSDLLQLQSKDVNMKNKEIYLPSGKVIKMDEYMEDILTDVLDPIYGNLYYKLDKSGDGFRTTNEVIELNPSSPYVFKVKPVGESNGMGYMSVPGFQTRLQSLSSLVNRNLKGVAIYRSGALHEMKTIKQDWKQKEIEDFIKNSNWEISASTAQMAFNSLYNE